MDQVDDKAILKILSITAGLWNQQKQKPAPAKGRNHGRKAEGYQTTETRSRFEDDLLKGNL